LVWFTWTVSFFFPHYVSFIFFWIIDWNVISFNGDASWVEFIGPIWWNLKRWTNVWMRWYLKFCYFGPFGLLKWRIVKRIQVKNQFAFFFGT
jgi:hypothetical protein